jgi:hypothetical protein
MEASGQLHTLAALPLGKSSSSHFLEGWVFSRAILYGFGEMKFSSLARI